MMRRTHQLGGMTTHVATTALIAAMVGILCAHHASGHRGAQQHLSVWPAPVNASAGSGSLSLSNATFTFKVTGATSPILDAAIARYRAVIFGSCTYDELREGGGGVACHASSMQGAEVTDAGAAWSHDGAALTSLEIAVNDGSEKLEMGTCENYTLSIASASSTSAQLASCTIWGAMRGLETFAQLVRPASNTSAAPASLSVAAPLHVQDYPRFPYRGIMIDTARHFMPVTFLYHIVDAMTASKLNVLHMHLTDDESFPIESLAHPELSALGAYQPWLVYTQAEVAALLTYAKARGIIVIPEIDMPAHCSSFAPAAPSLMVNCSDPFTHGNTLNPTLPATYDYVGALVADLAALFNTTDLFGVGGDELPADCWTGTPSISAWMKAHNMTTTTELEGYFIHQVAPHVTKASKRPLYWEEIFDAGIALDPTAVVEAWKSDAMPAILKAGFNAITSYKWYLNHGNNVYGDGTWSDFYGNDPASQAPNATAAELELLLGGESAMWNVHVDAVNFDPTVWPRAAATAEKLWSPRDATRESSAAIQRMSDHRCRLLNRGVNAGPLSIEDNVRLSVCQ